MSDIIQFNYKDHWQEEEINLERPNNSDESLGFIIAGGIDTPVVHHHFTYIIVKKIIENSLVYRDKRLKLYDLILRVNNIDFTNIKHEDALHILRISKSKVKILIRRLSPPITEEIELKHNGKLGISIAGGLGHDYFQNDHGIFITDINKDQTNKQLDIGDRLLQISSTKNTYDLRFVTYENAKKHIRLACAESEKIKLYVGHTRSIVREQSEKAVLRQDQYDPYRSKDENPVPVDKNHYSTVFPNHQDTNIEHLYADNETINTMPNEGHVDNRNELIISFDFNDYQRYENRDRNLHNRLLLDRSKNNSKVLTTVERDQSHAIKIATAPTVIDQISDHEVNTDVQKLSVDQKRNLTGNDSCRTTDAQQLKLKEATILDAHAEKLRRKESKLSQKARMNREDAIGGDSAGGLKWRID